MAQVFNSSLQCKQMLIIMLTSVVALLLTCTGFVVRDVSIYRQDLVQNLGTQAELIADHCTKPLNLKMREEVTQILAQLRSHEQPQCRDNMDTGA